MEAFKTNCLLFPGSDNAAESYGEALEQAGLKNEAIRVYRRALEIAPVNDDAKKGLQRLLHR
ncbi:MAG: tetratricopeptide repeat protein [Mucilaginibacter sp.]